MRFFILILFFPIALFSQTLKTNCKVFSTYIDGYFNYADLSSVNTPISFTANDTISLTIDGRGGQQNSTYKPYGVTKLYDTATHKFYFNELAVGDEVSIRFNINVTTTTNNQEFHIWLSLAEGGSFPYTVSDGVMQFKTTGQRQIGINIPIFIGANDTKNNPGDLLFTSDGNATITVNSFYISTKRRFY